MLINKNKKRCGVPEVVVSSKNADGLKGFTQAHVITQDSMQLVLIQEGQPVHSILAQREHTNILLNITSKKFAAMHLPFKTVLLSALFYKQYVRFPL